MTWGRARREAHMAETVLFWSVYALTAWKVLDDIWDHSIARELFALLVTLVVVTPVGMALHFLS